MARFRRIDAGAGLFHARSSGFWTSRGKKITVFSLHISVFSVLNQYISFGLKEQSLSTTSCLILDIGSGTQDVLLYQEGLELENCPKFILPSPARAVGARIRELTAAGKNIHLYGRNMGGGFWRALKAHQDAGLKVSADPEAALALGDDLDQVRGHGIDITSVPSLDASQVLLTDFDPGFWRGLLQHAGLPQPDLILACVQDHGFHPGKSNRISRFAYWERFMNEDGGDVLRLLYAEPPEEMTRLACLRHAIGVGMVADTGAAALLGALFDPDVERSAATEGVLVLNVGNSHTIAFLVLGNRVMGVYEHHTGYLDQTKLLDHLARFRRGELGNAEVFDDGGHGCVTVPDLPGGFSRTVVLGPRRALLTDARVEFLAPGGDMMLAGCFGLLKGWRELSAGR
jgi:uncharacterized protein (DUF1786 family)